MASPHEVIRYDLGEVKDLFDSCIVRAKLVDVHPSSNTVDIDTDIDEENPLWGQKNGVPVFYHCPETPDVDIGHQAFTRAMDRSVESGGGDVVVLVLCPNVRDQAFEPRASDLKVIGFASGLEYCEPVDLLVVSIDDKAFLVWDLINNQKVSSFLGEEVDPICSKDTFEAQYERLTIHSVPTLLEFGRFISEDIVPEFSIRGHVVFAPPEMTPLVDNKEWGCGNTFTMAKFVPVHCLYRDGRETVRMGVNGSVWAKSTWLGMSGLMETVDGQADLSGSCSGEKIGVWPDSEGLPEEDIVVEYSTTLEQTYFAKRDWSVYPTSCLPWLYAKYDHHNDRFVSHDAAKLEMSIRNDLLVGMNSPQGWTGPFGTTLPFEANPGDWGSKLLGNRRDGAKTFVSTEMNLYLEDRNEDLELWGLRKSCDSNEIYQFSSSPTVELTFTYRTHWGVIDTYDPLVEGDMASIEGWMNGHEDYPEPGIWNTKDANLKYAGAAEEDLQVQIFAHQRRTNDLYVKVHAGYSLRPEGEEDDYGDMNPNLLPQKSSFESAVEELIDFYYDGFATMENGIDWQWEFTVKRGELL